MTSGRSGWILQGAAASIFILALHMLFSGEGSYGEIQDAMTAALAVAAAGAALLAYRRRRDGWLLHFATGMGLWALAETLWAAYSVGLGIEVPFPSEADAFWLAGYVFLVYSFYLAFREAKALRNPEILTLAGYSVLVIVIFLAIRERILEASEDVGKGLINMAYLLGDSLMLSFSLPLVYGAAVGKARGIWIVICLAVALVCAGDIMFFVLTTEGAYDPGHWLNLLYMLGYTWAGAAMMRLAGEE